MAEEKRQFPTEMISLPSKGYLYPEDNPLSSGEVEVKYMTAREEDILTSGNLIQKGIVLDKLLEALVVSDVNLDDLLIGDKNAILLAARVLAYGKEYEVEVDGRKIEVDLTQLKDILLDESIVSKGSNEFEFELPSDITPALVESSDSTNETPPLKNFELSAVAVSITWSCDSAAAPP